MVTIQFDTVRHLLTIDGNHQIDLNGYVDKKIYIKMYVRYVYKIYTV